MAAGLERAGERMGADGGSSFGTPLRFFELVRPSTDQSGHATTTSRSYLVGLRGRSAYDESKGSKNPPLSALSLPPRCPTSTVLFQASSSLLRFPEQTNGHEDIGVPST